MDIPFEEALYNFTVVPSGIRYKDLPIFPPPFVTYLKILVAFPFTKLCAAPLLVYELTVDIKYSTIYLDCVGRDTTDFTIGIAFERV